MEKVNRIIDLKKTLRRKSAFLLGPRRVGKSTLVSQQLKDAECFDLLDSKIYRAVSADPSFIRNQILADKDHPSKLVVIDEVQLIPEILNEVHLLIERHGIRFLLTGSSARALKRKGINLLAGRAAMLSLHPFVRAELGSDFDLKRATYNGLIPSHYFSDVVDDDLSDYVGSYLREEVAAEGLTRSIPSFSRFLEVAALANGSMLNYSNISSDAEVKRLTVMGFFEILRDTLIGNDLPAWLESTKRKPVTTAKFYFFDPGVVRFLRKQGKIRIGSPEFGSAFEHYIFHELKSWCDYSGKKDLHYWRSTSDMEVDFVLDNRIAIEVKAKATLSNDDTKGLKALREDHPKIRFCVVNLSDRKQIKDGIEVWPYGEFLDALYNGELADVV